jgi:hypothetical protein
VWEKHGNLLLTGGTREAHIRQAYLSYDPNKLGGRAAGLPGQSGSNNSGEKKNDIIKTILRNLTKRVKQEEKTNPVYVIAAVAFDTRSQNDILRSFATKPELKQEYYTLLRRIYSLSHSNRDLHLPLEFQYSVLTTSSASSSATTSVHDLVGNPDATFTVRMPTASLVYTKVEELQQSSISSYSLASYHEQQQQSHQHSDMALTTPNQARDICSKYDRCMMMRLYEILYLDCEANTPGRKIGENLLSFVQRRCQRNPDLSKSNKTNNKKKGSSKKKKEEKERAIRDKEKYGSPTRQVASLTSTTTAIHAEEDNNIILSSEVMVNVNDDDEWMMCNDNDDLIELMGNLGFDLECDAVLESHEENKNHMRLNRELGSWVEVEVDGVNKRVTCNCEDYNFHYVCVHQVTFEVLQFNRLPDNTCSYQSERWSHMRTECIKYLKKKTFWT